MLIARLAPGSSVIITYGGAIGTAALAALASAASFLVTDDEAVVRQSSPLESQSAWAGRMFVSDIAVVPDEHDGVVRIGHANAAEEIDAFLALWCESVNDQAASSSPAP